MKTETIPYRGQYLGVIENGLRGSTPILFLHGNSASTQTWEKQFNSFLNDKYHLIAFDFLGFGVSSRSDQPNLDYNVNSLVGSVITVIQHFQLVNYFIVGHSLGGHIIVQSLDRLSGCKGMISIGAPPISSAQDIPKFYLPSAPTGIMFASAFTDEALQGVEDNFFYSPENKASFFKKDFYNTDAKAREAIGGILASSDFKNEVDVLSSNPIPKAFVNGKDERSINNEYYGSLDFPKTWKQRNNEIEHSAHMPHWENPDAVNQFIDEFVQAHIE